MPLGVDAILRSACLATLWLLCSAPTLLLERPERELKAYGLFADAARQIPSDAVIPYSVATELFADGASKFRFVSVPEGSQAQYVFDEVLDFPVGTTLVKTFAYPTVDGNTRLLETRLLRRSEDGWTPLVYIWDEAGESARLRLGGASIQVERPLATGQWVSHEYRVPDLNQCASCHSLNETLVPLGPSARNLNFDYNYPWGTDNQLDVWLERGILQAPEGDGHGQWRALPAVDMHDTSRSLDIRARTWLDVNCAHCHRPGGAAAASGLNLRFTNPDTKSLGIKKRPVAAGRGSGGRLFSIVPGAPEESILMYRIRSDDPGVMMPEIGRTIVDADAVQLVEQWIHSLD